MAEQDTFEAIKEHLESRGVESDKITAEADLFDDLGLDSLDTVELTVALEERFSIEVPDSELENVSTVKDAVQLIESKRAVSA